ncbi:FHA domain-containing protein [Aeoliella sp. SH292]|uniref:FHA domain-containing protein n=1 Tax=Aeoliella sp. SH292 TaxID=3454464 RepID=UPI003F99AE1F
MKLVVLAGAKSGTEIPLKKEKFVIGRASDCTLRAGSEAISRHHCAIVRGEEGLKVRDLGSRNGTWVNDNRIEAETLLKSGDKLRVGSLEFRIDLGQDINRTKKPKVASIGEAVSRTAAANPDDSAVMEDDISRWLIGPDPATSAASRDTQSFRMDETRTISDIPKLPVAATTESDETAETTEEVAEESKDKSKKSYGKLPPVPKKTTKDSREAAADILREMTRRR